MRAQTIVPGAGRRPQPVMLAIALSVLLHALGFWYLIEHAPVPATTTARGDDSRLSVTLTPFQPPTPIAPEAHQAPAAARPAPRPVLRKPIRQSDRSPAPAPIPNKPIASPESAQRVPATVTVTPAPADDMLTQLEAARKRRADAAAQDGTAAPEDDAQRANRIARANIAAAHPGAAQGADKDDHGGVFQIRRLGLHSAEFMFRGWNLNFRRNSTQLINVDQGADEDIRIAVVKQMIDLIRRHKSGDFVWDSHRLGREFTLSARPEHGSELQQFLLQEFFPGYVAAARR